MKRILITGCNRGLGLEFTRQYLELGWRVYATCRRPAEAESLQMLTDLYRSLSIHRLDITLQENVASFCQELRNIPLDILINNAGLYLNKRNEGLECIHYDDWQRTLEVNTLGAVRVTEALLQNIERSAGTGLVVVISSHTGSTLFLDEIGEMPLQIQKKFLRVLQEREYLPVGSTVSESSDFRLIAATNRDLEAMVEEGTFRDDLLFRLRTFHLELPPLRNRRADIAELAYSFRNRYSNSTKLKKKKLSTDYLMTLKKYEWPGNVRELFQAVEHSITDALESTILEPVHLPLKIRLAVTKKKLEKNKYQPTIFPESIFSGDLASMPTIKEDRERAIQLQEKHYLKTLLRGTGGDIKKCCETAGLSRSRLYDLLKKHGLTQNNTTLQTREQG